MGSDKLAAQFVTIQYFSNGAVYRGQWVDSEYHGQGELTWASGDQYSGAWSMGLMHGRGQYTYSDGARYPGDGQWSVVIIM